MATRTARSKPAAPVEPEELEDEFDELEDDETTEPVEDEAGADEAGADEVEELTEDEDELEEVDETPKPKAKRTPPKQPVIEFGSPWLAQYVTAETGEKFDARGVRMLLRKLAADGKLNRNVGTDRVRYQFTGPTDPTVQLVIGMIKSGDAKALKQAGLEKVKADAEAKKAAKKKAAELEEQGLVEEVDEVDEKPVTRRRTASKTAATPAKAAPSTTRRRTTAAK